MRFYKDDGKEYINAESPEKVTLEIALTEIGKLPTEGKHIGFVNGKEETIQFVRFEENGWLLDVPICEKGTYSHSLQDDDLTTENVKNIVKKFFKGEDWKSLCHLRSSKQESLREKGKRRIESFKEVGDEGAVMIAEETLTKEEFIKKLESFEASSNNVTYGIIAELSKPFIMIKKQYGKWEVKLDLENPNMDVEMSENKKESLDYEETGDITEWVNDNF